MTEALVIAVCIFAALMTGVAALLFLSAMAATGAYAGMGEILILLMVWLPLLVCGLIVGSSDRRIVGSSDRRTGRAGLRHSCTNTVPAPQHLAALVCGVRRPT